VFSIRVISLSLAALLVGCASRGEGRPTTPDVLPAQDMFGGVAFRDIDWDGQPGRGDAPLKNVVVSAVAGNQLIGETTTDSKGHFRFAVRPDIQNVRLEVETSWPFPVAGSGTGANKAASLDSPRWGRAAKRGVNTLLAVPPPVRCGAKKASSGPCGAWLLPNLKPVIDPPSGIYKVSYPGPRDSYLDTSTTPGAVLLRFGTYTVNEGSGPLQVIGAEAKASGQSVVQRIFNDRGGFTDRMSGRFVFHPGHAHIHVDAFEQYRLLDLSGRPVADGGKVSFCLTNVVAFPKAVAAAENPTTALRQPLDTTRCGEIHQGIDLGWSDYYGPLLPDQWIDVTKVDPGDYLLEIIVDPNDLLLETDETDNRITLPVTIGIAPPPAPIAPSVPSTMLPPKPVFPSLTTVDDR
jgi:hypothetical protein